MDAYAPMPVEGLAEAIGSEELGCAAGLHRRNLRVRRRIRSAVVDHSDRVSAQRRRTATE